MSVTPSQFELLSRLLDVSALRHRTLAQNVANINTPGYRRLEVSFEEELARRLGTRTESEALTNLKPVLHESSGGITRADGNNVDIDRELGRLSKNTLLFNTYAQILGTRIGMMRSAITGR